MDLRTTTLSLVNLKSDTRLLSPASNTMCCCTVNEASCALQLDAAEKLHVINRNQHTNTLSKSQPENQFLASPSLTVTDTQNA